MHNARDLKIAALSLLLGGAFGCAQPQYTVMNASSTPTSSVSTQITSYPDLSKVDATGKASRDVAVIIAIEDYAFLPDVPGAIENANAWETYLRQAKGFGEVFVLTDKQAPIEEIRRFTAQAVAAAPEGGALWFVFIGHGAALKDGTDGALIGMDAQQTIESIGSRSIPRKELLATLERGKQAQTVVVLDTCFSGRDGAGELLAQGTQPVIAVNATPQLAAGTVVLSAAGNDEVAGQLPGAPRPAFSYLLLGALRGWADDGDGTVTADEAISWTRQQLRHVKGRQQTPGLDGDRGLALAVGAAETDPGIAALMKADGSAAAPVDIVTAAPDNGDGTRIDTNKGVIFVKPGEWGVGPVGMGVVIHLTNQYSGNAIVVMRQKMKQAYAAQALGAPSPRFDDERVEVLRPPASAEYGGNKGKESEFKVISTDEATAGEERHIRWGTYQNGAAWIIDLVVRDEGARDDDYATFQKFLETLQFN